MEATVNGGHVTKKVFRYMKDNIMERSLASVMLRLTEMEKLLDGKVSEKKKEEKNNIPLFEDGTLESLLKDVMVQGDAEEEFENIK